MSTERIVVYIIDSLIQSFAITFILQMQDKKLSKKQKVKFLLLSWILISIGAIFIPNSIRFVFSFTFFSIILYFLINIKDRKAIIYSFNIMFLTAVSEIIISLAMVIFGIKPYLIVTNVFYNLLANILISLVSILLIIIPFINNIIKKLNKFLKEKKSSIYYLFFLTIILYLLNLKNGLEFIFKSNYYINIIILFCFIILFCLVILKELKSEQLKEINKQTVSYIEKYEKIITEQGKANHEFKNQLMVLKGYSDMNSPMYKEYLNNIIDDSKKTKSTYLISQLNKFPDGGIKGLLYYKLSLMEENNIKYEIYSEEKAKDKLVSFDMQQMSLITKVLGVLLDNAIEASKEVKDKKVNISLDNERGKIIFTVSNSCNNVIDNSKFGTGFTTKGKGHGFGLRLVNDIVRENDYLSYSTSKVEDTYIVKFEIKTSKKKK